MLAGVLLYVGSAILFAWGVAHVVPTRNVVLGFGSLTEDNRVIITMEWVAEGLALAFVGVLTALVTAIGGPGDPVARVVYRAVIGFCVVLGAWTFAVGRQSSILPIRLCPLVLAVTAGLLAVGSTL